MTILYFAKYTSYTYTFDILDDNALLTQSVPMIATLNMAGRAMLNSISALDMRKDQDRKGPAKTKEEEQQELGQQALSIAAIIRSFASVTKNTMLKEQMKFTYKDLFNGPDHGLSLKAETILNEARMRLPELQPFGITPALVEDYAARLSDYRAVVGGPRRGIASSKDAGKQMAQHFANLQLLFKEQLDPLVNLFKKDHPTFYNQYKSRRMIINPARHRTKLGGLLADKRTGKPLAGGLVKLDGTNIIATSDAEGNYELPLGAGLTLQVTFIVEGYQPLTITVKGKKGKTVISNVALEPVA